MTCNTSNCSIASETAFRSNSSDSKLLSALRAAWESYRRWSRRRETIHALSSLDAHTLKDIGLDASEIESLVYGDPAERRHRYDELGRGRWGA